MKRVRLRVHGRVQGVFFRQSTKERATQLRLSGWVRNMDDGSVEIETWGAAAAVDALVSWCWQGPPSAAVADVIVTRVEDALPDEGGAPSFIVR